ncbi:CopD family protein [Trinickia fusca]|uniref:Protoporphyrinogen IX oxidase n=1 Tax=Trinickia fusca TaxID=2419777 RepID=A0A494XAS8_9BURK|nr:CopD family protein [Trinickia fusca]RKP47610.1 hypothetical protein D7S89_15410 [Trinickia fusca]
MLYLWLKALHVGAVLVLLGGLLVLALTVATFSKLGDIAHGQARTGLLDAVRRWDRCVTSPAMVLVWGLGIALALKGDWFRSPWLIIKLCFVIFLSALHGMLSGMLRRLGRENSRPAPRMLRLSPAAIVASTIAIAILVIVKPFS